MTIEDITAIARTQTAESSLIPGLWLSRSAVALRPHSGRMLPVFGFAADFDAELSRRKSVFELIEHLAFHPYKPVLSNHVEVLKHTNGRWQNAPDYSIDSLLLGALNFGENLHGNGCAVHTSLHQAASHAENEVLERHYCCAMWYNRLIRPRPLETDIRFNEKYRNAVRIYEVGYLKARHLVISIIDIDDLNFFCMGASLKSSRDEAIRHCIGEAATLFEDAMRLRAGSASTVAARSKILSLRDRKLSQDRKRYFSLLLTTKDGDFTTLNDVSEIYAFRVWNDIVASRASTVGLLTPRRFHNRFSGTPVMPLF
jgi:hypothetical protein